MSTLSSIAALICAAPDAAGADVIPVGRTVMFDESVRAPRGWLVCDGSWVSVDDYPFLFAAIGHRFSGGWVRRFVAGRGRPGAFRLPTRDQAQAISPWSA